MVRIAIKGIIISMCLIIALIISEPISAQEILQSGDGDAMSFEKKQRAILENGVFVVNGYLLGAWDGENWMGAEQAFPFIPDYMYYDVYTKDEYNRTIHDIDVGYKYIDDSGHYAPGGNVDMKDILRNSLLNTIDYIAAKGLEPLKFSYFNKLHPGNPVYQEWTDEVVASGENPKLELKVREVYGDNEYNGEYGTFLIIADNGHQKSLNGDVIFIRRKMDDGVYKNFILDEGVFESGTPGIYLPSRLVFACDLNHDGDVEYILKVRGNNGVSQMAFTAFSYQNNEYKKVLNGGWSE